MRFTAFFCGESCNEKSNSTADDLYDKSSGGSLRICDRDECEVVADHRVRTGAERHCQDFSSLIHEWDHIVHRERICQAGQHSGHGSSIDAHELRDHIENRGEKF